MAQSNRAQPVPRKTVRAPAEKPSTKEEQIGLASGQKAGLPLFLQRSGSERSSPPGLQVNTPGDGFEQEADAVAGSVLTRGASAPGGVLSRPASISRLGSSSREASSQAASGQSNSSTSRQPSPTAAAAPAMESEAIQHPEGGAPLDPAVRERVEPVLGADLSQVRLHDGTSDSQLARGLNARAFTHRNHIWLGQGESAEDVELLAHESTHVVQQTGGKPPQPAIQRAPTDTAEPTTSVAEPAVSRLEPPPPMATPARSTPGPEGAESESEKEVRETSRSFARTAENKLGLGEGYLENPDDSALGLPSEGEAGQRAEEALSDINSEKGALQAEIAGAAKEVKGDSEEAAEPGAELGPGMEGEAAPEPETAPMEGAGGSAEGARLPLDEIAGPGPDSEEAMVRLRGVNDANPALVTFGVALSARIGELRAGAAATTAQAAGRLQGEAGAQRAALRSSMASHQAEASSLIEGSRGYIEESGSAASATVAEQGAEAHGSNAEFADSETTRLQENLDGSTEEAGNIFVEADTEVSATGESEAERGQQDAYDKATRALELGRTEVAYYRRTETDTGLAEDKAEAVTEVAEQFALQLRTDGDNLHSDVLEQTAAAQEQIAAEQEPTVAGLTDFAPTAADGIRTFLGSVDEGVDTAVEQGQTQVEAAQSGVLVQVDRLGTATQTRGEAMAAQGEASLDVALTGGLLAQANLAGTGGADARRGGPRRDRPTRQRRRGHKRVRGARANPAGGSSAGRRRPFSRGGATGDAE